jgi:hypothetical protein
MNLLPLVGLAAGLVIGDRRAALVTVVLAGVGLGLVATFTDEIDGWADPYVWGITLASLLATMLGVAARKRITSRRKTRSA